MVPETIVSIPVLLESFVKLMDLLYVNLLPLAAVPRAAPYNPVKAPIVLSEDFDIVRPPVSVPFQTPMVLF